MSSLEDVIRSLATPPRQAPVPSLPMFRSQAGVVDQDGTHSPTCRCSAAPVSAAPGTASLILDPTLPDSGELVITDPVGDGDYSVPIGTIPDVSDDGLITVPPPIPDYNIPDFDAPGGGSFPVANAGISVGGFPGSPGFRAGGSFSDGEYASGSGGVEVSTDGKVSSDGLYSRNFNAGITFNDIESSSTSSVNIYASENTLGSLDVSAGRHGSGVLVSGGLGDRGYVSVTISHVPISVAISSSTGNSGIPSEYTSVNLFTKDIVMLGNTNDRTLNQESASFYEGPRHYVGSQLGSDIYDSSFGLSTRSVDDPKSALQFGVDGVTALQISGRIETRSETTVQRYPNADTYISYSLTYDLVTPAGMTGSFNLVSSRESKHSLISLTDAVSTVLGAESLLWRYVNNPADLHIGPMAEDLPEIFHMVRNDGLFVDLTVLVGYLWGALGDAARKYLPSHVIEELTSG